MPQFLAFIAAALLLAPSLGLWAEPARESSSELFTDVSRQAGITWSHFNGQSQDRFLIEASSGGVAFLDYDNDSDLDLVIVNGHVSQTIELSRGDIRYRQLPLLLANVGGLKFRNMASRAGPVFHTGHSARGMAVGDYDNDGDLDVVFVRLNERPVLLRNNTGQEGAWIGFELQGNLSNRDAIGSKLSLRSGAKRFTRWVSGGSSFLASHDKRVVFGLGKPPKEECSLEIRWPSGKVQTVSGLKINRYHKIAEPAETPGPPNQAANDGKDRDGSVNR